jgi:uncharacterized protein (DUF983 family)
LTTCVGQTGHVESIDDDAKYSESNDITEPVVPALVGLGVALTVLMFVTIVTVLVAVVILSMTLLGEVQGVLQLVR